jgi:RimJ/RimL family protein N-acetyltransferase
VPEGEAVPDGEAVSDGEAVPERAMAPDEGFIDLPAARVALRRFRPGDLDAFVAYRSDALVARYQSWDAPYPRVAGQRFIQDMTTQQPDTAGEWFQFAVILRSTGELIGDCAARPDAGDPRQAEIGFTIAPAHQGHGYATEAVGALIDYLFWQRAKHRVMACCDERNQASVRVLERLGMRREGHLRESTWAKGEWTDDLIYALLDREWQSLPKTESPAG